MGDSILEWNTRDPLFGWAPEQLESELRTRLAGRAQAAFLFGSYGTKRFGADSDLDLILVVPTSVPFVERPVQFKDLLDLVPTMDILVYTPQEFERLTTDPSPGFWTSVTSSMHRLL